MNVDEKSLHRYIETLHETVSRVGDGILESEQTARLLHNSLLPASITGYLSTQFGIAIEYSPAARTNISVVRGSARVEDIVFRGPKQLRTLPLMMLVKGANCSISGGGTFVDGFPLRLAAESSEIVVDNFNFKVDFLQWKRHIHYLELYGDRSAARWSIESAKARAKDEVLAAVYLARQAARDGANLAEYIERFRKNSVLVLGSYQSTGTARLEVISNELRTLGYKPVLVADIPDFEHYDLSQKVVAIAAVCRFVVIDDSEPSGHLNEVELCKANRWVTVLLRAGGATASSMTLGASITSNVIHELAYETADPAPAVKAAALWAEERLSQLEKELRSIYPYRTQSNAGR